MSAEPLPKSELILYQTEDGRTRIQCRFENETLWLTQAQIAGLFEVTVPNVNLHLKSIYAEGELTEAATIKSYLVSARKLPVLKVAGDFGIFPRALLSSRRVFAAR